MTRPDVLIVGAGLQGVTSAYVLARRGLKVAVIDRRGGPGEETSFANGGLLTPGMSDPWNAPGCWRTLLHSLISPSSPLQLRWKSLPGLSRWGPGFLLRSSTASFDASTLANLRLAQHSMEILAHIQEETQLDFDFAPSGSLKVFRDNLALQRAAAIAASLRSHGLVSAILSPAEVSHLEPAIARIADELAGAIHYPDDAIGDSYKFCLGMAHAAAELGVDFRFCETALRLATDTDRVTQLETSRGSIAAGHFILAGGSFTRALARTAGVAVPVQPVKGYSITYPASTLRTLLRTPIVDDSLHAVATENGGAIFDHGSGGIVLLRAA